MGALEILFIIIIIRDGAGRGVGGGGGGGGGGATDGRRATATSRTIGGDLASAKQLCVLGNLLLQQLCRTK